MRLEQVLSDFQKKFGDVIKDPRGAGEVKTIKTESPQINYIFGGGFPMGRIIELFGPESGGKTTLTLYIASQIQNQSEYPRTIAYFDLERTFNYEFAKLIGVNPDNNFLLIRPKYAEEVMEMIEKMATTKEVSLFVIDSIAAMVSREGSISEFGKITYGGDIPRILSTGLPRLALHLDEAAASLICINQVRVNLDRRTMYSPSEKTPGGRSLPFYSSWRGRVSKGEDLVENNLVTGTKIVVKNVKSKVGFPKRQAELSLSFSDGFDIFNEYIDFGLKLDLISRSGPYYTLSLGQAKVKAHGMKELKKQLSENESLWGQLKELVDTSIQKVSRADYRDILDGDDIDEEGYD